MSYKLEVEKWNVTFRVTNSKVILFCFTSELLTRRLNFCFCFQVTNWKLKNKIFHFELLTRKLNFYFFNILFEFRNSWVTKSSYETELRKMTSHFKFQASLKTLISNSLVQNIYMFLQKETSRCRDSSRYNFWKPVLLEKCQKAVIPCILLFPC